MYTLHVRDEKASMIQDQPLCGIKLHPSQRAADSRIVSKADFQNIWREIKQGLSRSQAHCCIDCARLVEEEAGTTYLKLTARHMGAALLISLHTSHEETAAFMENYHQQHLADIGKMSSQEMLERAMGAFFIQHLRQVPEDKRK